MDWQKVARGIVRKVGQDERQPEAVRDLAREVGESMDREAQAPSRELLKKMRALWQPKLPEVEAPCLSCPFREGNAREWRDVVLRLRKAFGLRGPVTSARLEKARALGIADALRTGDFACHSTVYDAQGDMLPIAGRRQCAGASAAFREGRRA